MQRQEWRVLMREQDYAAAVPSFPLHFAQTVFTRTCTAPRGCATNQVTLGAGRYPVRTG